ncbi:MAG: formylglycine-generating enzyme family protein [Rhodospirillaceae bacterium]|nr:formylglycine-generating enzyme family protein [Rhodospirillaceae bacterium]
MKRFLVLAAMMMVLATNADASSRGQPGTTFKDCPGCPEMVVIPAGSFRMGDLKGEGNSWEKPVHKVSISKLFAVGIYEVTQREWLAVMGSNPSQFKGHHNPVENISWNDAQDFMKQLTSKTGLKYRLLSEAEWEYSARAGTNMKYHCGDDIGCPESVAWHSGNSSRSTHPVGQKKANSFGLYDMHGNVGEWVDDCFFSGYQGAPTDGRANFNSRNVSSSWPVCKNRVIRGGSWRDTPSNIRSASRRGNDKNDRYSNYGFRIARDLNDSELKASNSNQSKKFALPTPPKSEQRSKTQSGKYFVERVQVTKSTDVKSDTIVKRVTDALTKRAKKHLPDKSTVVLLVHIGRMRTPSTDRNKSVKIYMSQLSGSFRLVDKASKTILAQSSIDAAYREPHVGGAGDVENMVINRFVTLVVRKLKQGN